MQYKEETKLSESKIDYDNITIPNNIDEYILRGIKKYPRAKRIGLRLRPLSVAAVIALFVLISMIRISPVFADYLDDVPILKYIVKLVNYDKGLKSAVENNFIQNVALSDEHEGVKFTVDNIIVDEARLIVFYTIENNSIYKYLEMNNVKFTDEAGKAIEAGYSFGFFYDKQDPHKIQDNLKVSFGENTIIPETIHLEVELHQKETPENYVNNENRTKLPYIWQVDIPIDKSKFANMKEVYDINQTVEIENQKISIKKAIISPTRIEVQVEFSEENTKRILRFDNLKILNEKGETLNSITNDVNASMPDENHVNLYFESNFFSKPQELYIQGSSIRALDKDKLNIVVDFHKKLLLKAPDNNIVLKDITDTAEGTVITFLLNTDEVLDDKYHYFVFTHKAADAKGTEFDIGRASHSGISDSAFNQDVLVTIPKNIIYQNPIKIEIEDFPVRIKGDFKIRIK